MTIYFAGASVVFSILLTAFLKDGTTPKNHVSSWVFLAIATLVWPVVVPSMVHKVSQRKAKEEVPVAAVTADANC
jgi:MFS-type transporter involved in bile tolerance (Atg22 family)